MTLLQWSDRGPAELVLSHRCAEGGPWTPITGALDWLGAYQVLAAGTREWPVRAEPGDPVRLARGDAWRDCGVDRDGSVRALPLPSWSWPEADQRWVLAQGWPEAWETSEDPLPMARVVADLLSPQDRLRVVGAVARLPLEMRAEGAGTLPPRQGAPLPGEAGPHVVEAALHAVEALGGEASARSRVAAVLRAEVPLRALILALLVPRRP